MGREATIYVSTVDEYEPDGYCYWHRVKGYPVGPSWYLIVGESYYGQGYERGRWPRILHSILGALSNPRVAKVWYGSDDGGEFDLVTPYFIETETRRWVAYNTKPFTRHDYRGSDEEKADTARLARWIAMDEEEGSIKP